MYERSKIVLTSESVNCMICRQLYSKYCGIRFSSAENHTKLVSPYIIPERHNKPGMDMNISAQLLYRNYVRIHCITQKYERLVAIPYSQRIQLVLSFTLFGFPNELVVFFSYYNKLHEKLANLELLKSAAERSGNGEN